AQADAGAARDVAERCLRSLLRHHGPCHLEDARAVALRVDALRTRRWGGGRRLLGHGTILSVDNRSSAPDIFRSAAPHLRRGRNRRPVDDRGATMPRQTMMAVRVHVFGGPEALVYEEVPLPEPEPDEVLVQVHAAGLSPADWYARAGFANLPEAMRPSLPLPFTPGEEVSGVVAAVGPEVAEWEVGDEVFGLVRFPQLDNNGRGYAEY